MKLENLLTKYRSLVIVGLVVVLAFLTLVIVLPEITQIQQAYTTMDAQQKKLDKEKEKLRQLQGLNEFELRQKADILLKAVSREDDPFTFVYIISKLAKDNGLIVTNLSTSRNAQATTNSATNEENKFSAHTHSINLSVEGTKELVRGFLEGVNKTFPIISVNSVSMVNDDDKLLISITLNSFYLPLPENIGKADSPLPAFTIDQEKTIQVLGGFSEIPESTAAGQIVNPGGRANPFSL